MTPELQAAVSVVTMIFWIGMLLVLLVVSYDREP